jgi:hypothetical protein
VYGLSRMSQAIESWLKWREQFYVIFYDGYIRRESEIRSVTLHNSNKPSDQRQ